MFQLMGFRQKTELNILNYRRTLREAALRASISAYNPAGTPAENS
jgi:hypothetical protein